MDDLPRELIYEIANFLDTSSLCRFSILQRNICDFLKDQDTIWNQAAKRIWKHLRVTRDVAPAYQNRWRSLVLDKNQENRSFAMPLYFSVDLTETDHSVIFHSQKFRIKNFNFQVKTVETPHHLSFFLTCAPSNVFSTHWMCEVLFTIYMTNHKTNSRESKRIKKTFVRGRSEAGLNHCLEKRNISQFIKRRYPYLKVYTSVLVLDFSHYFHENVV